MNVILLTQAQLTGSTGWIDDPHQLQHIHQVLTAKVGDVLKIGALGGRLGAARISAIQTDRVCLDMVALTQTPPPKLPVTVVLALPRPKVLRRLIMDMTALGVGRIILINSYRTDKSYWQSPLLARLDEFVLEGLQQGVDSIAPVIELEKRFKPFVEDRLASLGKQLLVAHPYADMSMSNALAAPLPDVLIVGAEGGFIPYEIELMRTQGVQVATLGVRILRTEAAVNALLGRWLA